MTDTPNISLTWITDEHGVRTPYPDFIEQTHVDQMIADLHVRSSDVFVSSYPKSGTTWLQQICHLLAHEGVQGERSPLDTVPWIEAHMLQATPAIARKPRCCITWWSPLSGISGDACRRSSMRI